MQSDCKKRMYYTALQIQKGEQTTFAGHVQRQAAQAGKTGKKSSKTAQDHRQCPVARIRQKNVRRAKSILPEENAAGTDVCSRS
jgi:hypothetical protein